MVKIKSISKKQINFGKVNGKLLYFKPNEVKDLSDSPELSELIANAVDDGFLEIVTSKAEEFIKKVINPEKKQDKKKDIKSDKEEVKK